ncbi:MAG: hypothetical protein KGJ35_02640 [Patescibacteria group bacterium]|nr:hypothetical protein [Patescibacteria group bacterium]
MKKTIIAISSLLSSIFAPAVVFATSGNTSCSGTTGVICNPLQSVSITGLLNNAVDIAIAVGAVVSVIMFIYAGFRFIFAQGKPDEISKTWKLFMYVAIGTAVLIGAKVIVSVITGTLTSTGLVNSSLFGG